MNKIMKYGLLIGLCLCILCPYAQTSGAFKVNGDADKYYPVTFNDANWWSNQATELEIGRSAVHWDYSWWGSIISKFRFHSTQWGNGASFIDADMRNSVKNFIAGWRDASISNGNTQIIIWLLGGGTDYGYNANGSVSPVVYDGVQNALPFHETNGPDHSYKTSIESYVNTNEKTLSSDLLVNGNTKLEGNVGIVTTNPQAKLDVNGAARVSSLVYNAGDGIKWSLNGTANGPSILMLQNSGLGGSLNRRGSIGWMDNNGGQFEYLTWTDAGNILIGKTSQNNSSYMLDVAGNIRGNKVVVNTNGADFVFDSSYKLSPLDEVEKYIQQNHHLPDIESAKQMKEQGLNLGDNQTKLLQKIEELTLHVIELKKEIDILKSKKCK
jgi:hypothetical protein